MINNYYEIKKFNLRTLKGSNQIIYEERSNYTDVTLIIIISFL